VGKSVREPKLMYQRFNLNGMGKAFFGGGDVVCPCGPELLIEKGSLNKRVNFWRFE